MIALHQYPPSWGLPSASPFCVKIELYLKAARLEYKTVVENNPGKGPKGKMPFIEDKGNIISDSSFILKYLKKEYGDILDKDLNKEQNAIMLAFQKLIEENLYWALLYSRWGDPIWWKIMRLEFKPMLPPVVGSPILAIIRKNLLKQLHGQGFGRHSEKEIYELGIESIEAISHFLGDKKFFMGEKLTTIDTTVYSFLTTILWTPIHSPLYQNAKSLVNLEPYCNGIKEMYFSS